MRFRNAFVLTAGLFASGISFAGPIVPGFDSNAFRGDYYSNSGAVDIGFTINFFGNEYSQLYVNVMGNVGFGSSGSGGNAPRMAVARQPTLAPFVTDGVDTRYAGSPVTYGIGTYDGQAAFGVNWVDIDYFGNGLGLSDGTLTSTYRFANPDDIHAARNSYQLIIVDRSNGDFDFIFNYDSIQWEYPNTHVGWSRGYKNGWPSTGEFFELGDLSDYERYNTGPFLDGGSRALAGLTYTFQVRDGIVFSPIITTTIPEPETWAMLLAGLGIVGSVAAKRRRRQG